MKHIQAIIWDMDGVKYRFGQEFADACFASAAALAMERHPHIDRDTAIGMARASWEKYHSSYEFLHRDHGMDLDELTVRFHDALDIDFIGSQPASYFDHLDRCGVAHIILTQGDRRWAGRILGRTGIDHFFTPDRVITCEDFFPHKKANSVEPFRLALSRLGCAAEQAVMVEDTQINLKHAKDLGLTTVLVHPKPDDVQQSYTDHVFHSLTDFMTYFAAARRTAI